MGLEREKQPGGRRPRPPRRGAPAATIRDVAASAGVSTATVSRVFGESGGRVSSVTRRRVMHAAQELGYRPHRGARALARQRSGLIGVLLVGFGSGFVGDVMDGLVEAARGCGREVVFASYGRAGYGSLHRALDHLLGMRAEGIIFYPPNSLPIDDPLLVADLKRLPTVLVDLAIEGLDLPLVTTDDASGVRQAVGYLVSLGHERIAHLAGPSWMSTGALRLGAFREAMAERGLQTRDEWLVRYDFTYGQAVVAAQRLFQATVLPTAVLAADDKCAAAVFEVARHAGLRVPDDLSVIGFSDTFLCHTWQPPLTTVRQPKEELGREAMRLLAAVIEGDTSVDATGVHLLPTQLVVRGSCARRAG
jgi:DNA-binding LacI/PurR family transcriptional regulator